MHSGLYVKYLLFLSDFKETNFLDVYPKKPQISNFMEICAEGDVLFHADGRTDMTTLIVAFRCFANAPNTN
jgi:hypothetical protein